MRLVRVTACILVLGLLAAVPSVSAQEPAAPADPPAAVPVGGPPPAPALPDSDEDAWDVVKHSQDPAMYEAYMQKFGPRARNYDSAKQRARGLRQIFAANPAANATPEPGIPGQVGAADVCHELSNGWENCCAGRLSWSASEIQFKAKTIPGIPSCSSTFIIGMAEVKEVQKNTVIGKNRGAFHIKAGKKNYNLAPIDRVGNFDTMVTDELVTRLQNVAGKLGF